MPGLKLSRRTVIRGAGSIAIALPWLEIMRTQQANAQAVPSARRFLAVFAPGGTLQELQGGVEGLQAGTARYWPTGTETAPVLSPILASLAPIHHKLLTIRGLSMAVSNGTGHPAGMSGLLTGSEQTGGGESSYSALPSIDQILTTRISKGKKPRASIQMGIRWASVGGNGFEPVNIINFEDGPGANPIAPSVDPVAIYKDLFGQAVPAPSTPVPAGTPDVRVMRKKSILDYVDKRFVTLASRLGAADRAKLEQHLEKLREIEKGLSGVGGGVVIGGKCQVPQQVDTTGFDTSSGNAGGAAADALIPKVGKYMMDMMVMALACDITAVGTLQWADAEAKHTFPWLNLQNHHHFYQHDGGYRPLELEQIYTWYAQQNAYLLQEMDKVDMGGHTLLDESVVFFGSEIGWPESHARDNVPIMLAGGAGSLRGGRHLDFRVNKSNLSDAGIPHNNLLVSIMNMLGDPRTEVQQPGKGHCANPISNLI